MYTANESSRPVMRGKTVDQLKSSDIHIVV